MSNASMAPERNQEQNGKHDQEHNQEQKAGVRKPVQKMRYSEGGCPIDGHQGYGCTCNQISARP